MQSSRVRSSAGAREGGSQRERKRGAPFARSSRTSIDPRAQVLPSAAISYFVYECMKIVLKPDTYKSGCFNLLCPGFLVRSPDFGLGIEITQLSTYGGIQESIEIVIFKDPKTGNWWLAYGEEKFLVGYWPKELFNNLSKGTEVDWGGAVSSPFSKPSPPMGSGHLSIEGPNKTCYFLNDQLINDQNQLYEPDQE